MTVTVEILADRHIPALGGLVRAGSTHPTTAQVAADLEAAGVARTVDELELELVDELVDTEPQATPSQEDTAR